MPNNLGVTIASNANQDSDGDGIGDNAGGTLDPNGGTLVYNRRGTNVPTVTLNEAGVQTVFQGGDGPLNDPTAMMYVMTSDLAPVAEMAAEPGGACFNAKGKNKGKFNPSNAGCAEELAAKNVDLGGCMTSGGGYDPKLPTCQVKLRDEAPVEPLVLRANAGDCIEVTLRNRLVAKQAVTADTGAKVYYADGKPVFADLGKSLDWFLADGVTPVARNNVVLDQPPDLAGWQDMMWAVTRRIQPAADGNPVNDEMHFFNNNLVRPGAYAGIHPQLVEYDASRDDGVWVGKNQPQIAPPGGTSNARYYAGHLEYVPVAGRNNRRSYQIQATPVEFGGSNLLSADRVKQPQKGLFGALVIEPQGATVTEGTLVADGQGSGDATRPTRAQVTVSAPNRSAGAGGTYREAIAVTHKITNLRWKDGSAIKNIHQGELGVEGAEDSGHAGYNYGMEPSWFRFQLPPNVPFGAGVPGQAKTFGDIPNQQAFYANELVENEPNAIPAIAGVSAAGDPQTPIFRTTAGTPSRMHVLNGASADRDSTFVLHGHLWQRDPYVCPDDSYLVCRATVIRRRSPHRRWVRTRSASGWRARKAWATSTDTGRSCSTPAVPVRYRVTTCSATTRQAVTATACLVSSGSSNDSPKREIRGHGRPARQQRGAVRKGRSTFHLQGR